MYNDYEDFTVNKAVKGFLIMIAIVMVLVVATIASIHLIYAIGDKAIDGTGKAETNSNATAQVYYLHGSIISNENGIITIADTNGEAWEIESDNESLHVGVNVVMMMNDNNTINDITDDTIINTYIQINS